MTAAPPDARSDVTRRRAGPAVLALFTATSFLGAVLVFLVQPMVSKRLLPLLGGTPAVWNTSMVFFQGALLLGYGYTHLATTRLRSRAQVVVHLVVLLVPLVALPIALPSGWTPPASVPPAVWLLFVLTVMAGLPYFAVATTSPLLQRWFSLVGHRQSGDPYFLYAAGNVGSVIGLLSYPLFVEANFTLRGQARLWASLYALFVLFCALCALVARRMSEPTPLLTGLVPDVLAVEPISDGAVAALTAEKVSWKTRGRWLLLAAIPSSLTIGVTTTVSVDIAAIPLFWVVPLTVYLLTFIAAFGRRSGRLLRPSRIDVLFPAVVGGLAGLATISDPSLRVLITAHVAVLAVGGLLCHGRLAQERPHPSRLTEFYLCLALGGVLGGIFNAIIAPQIFSSIVEEALILSLALLVRPRRWFGSRPTSGARAKPGVRQTLVGVELAVGMVLAGLIVSQRDRLAGNWHLVGRVATVSVVVGVGIGVVFWARPVLCALCIAGLFANSLRAGSTTLLRERSFYAAFEVDDTEGRHELLNGTTLHGSQWVDPAKRRIATTYYHRFGPIGQVMSALAGDSRRRRVGVVGLGSGTLASYAERGEQFDFYEIDSAVRHAAEDPALFTYLIDARARGANVRVRIGDARLTLAHTADGTHGLLVLDAFSSDAIPVHLLTDEAVGLYLRKLTPGGLLAVHISNRYVDLQPVVAAIAADLHLSALVRNDNSAAPQQAEEGGSESDWIVLSRRSASLEVVRKLPGWHKLEQTRRVRAWTDEYSNVRSVLSFG